MSAVPPLMVRTDANPGGLPKAVFDDFQAQLAAGRSQFYRDVRGGTFSTATNRPGAETRRGGHRELVAPGHDGGARRPTTTASSRFSQTDFTEDLKKITIPGARHARRRRPDRFRTRTSAPLSATLLRNGQLKTYPGFSARHADDPRRDDQRRPARLHRGLARLRRQSRGDTDDGLEDPAVLRPAIAIADPEVQVPAAEAGVDDQIGLVIEFGEPAEPAPAAQLVVALQAYRGFSRRACRRLWRRAGSRPAKAGDPKTTQSALRLAASVQGPLRTPTMPFSSAFPRIDVEKTAPPCRSRSSGPRTSPGSTGLGATPLDARLGATRRGSCRRARRSSAAGRGRARCSG